jgi:hypothetical protein
MYLEIFLPDVWWGSYNFQGIVPTKSRLFPELFDDGEVFFELKVQ